MSVVHDNNKLSSLSPKISLEWHSTKNGNLSPYNFVEVTGFTKRSRNYFSYLRNIVAKKRYVEEILGAKFEFIYKKLLPKERDFVSRNLK